MRLARPDIAAAAALALLIAGAVGTAPASASRVVCHLVTDPAGDATDASVRDTPVPGLPPGIAPNDDFLDVLSADLASDGKVVTAVVRLKEVGVDPTSPFATRITLSFRIGSKDVSFLALPMQGGSEFYYGSESSGARTQGAVDPVRKEIRMSAPGTGWGVPIRRGTVFRDLKVRAERWVIYPLRTFPGGVPLTADTAAGSRAYVVGTRSCVVPGA